MLCSFAAVLYPAAIPALALAFGIAAGIFLPVPSSFCVLTFIVCWLCAAFGFATRRERLFLAAIISGFISTGALLGARANGAALHTPLGDMFDRHVPPQTYQLFANVEGVLRADAALAPSGATLSLNIDRIEIEGMRFVTAGGALVGVGGALGSNSVGEWRAGRRVRLAVTLRRPATYLDPGVPDSWREFGWKGTTLVGSAKSDRLDRRHGPACR